MLVVVDEQEEIEEVFLALMSRVSEEDEDDDPSSHLVRPFARTSSSVSAPADESDSCSTAGSEDESDLVHQYGELLNAFKKSKKIIKDQLKELEFLRPLKAGGENISRDLRTLQRKSDQQAKLISEQETMIRDLQKSLTAEKNILLKFSKPQTILPIIDTFSGSVSKGAGLGYDGTSQKGKSANTLTFVREERPTGAPSQGECSTSRPRLYKNQLYTTLVDKGKSKSEAPIHITHIQYHHAYKPPSGYKYSHSYIEGKKGKYNMYECWCCGKRGHFSIDCRYNKAVHRDQWYGSSDFTQSCVRSIRSNIRNQGPKHSWAPKV